VGVAGNGARRIASIVCVTALAALGFAAQADAASFTVNSFSDTNDGSCTASLCSLRDAIVAADATPGASTITLAAGTYKLTRADSAPGQLDDPTVGDLDINAGVSLTITGAGATQTIIDANHIDRAFAVHAGGSLTLSGVTIQRGDTSTFTAANDSTDPGYGAAIYNDGSLTITGSTLMLNTAEQDGGGIYSDTAATSTSVTDSSISLNNGDGPGGGGLAFAAGSVTLTGDTLDGNDTDGQGGFLLDNSSPGALTISDSTASSNSSGDDGGALALMGSGAVTVTNSTLDSNDSSADGAGGAIVVYPTETLTIQGSTLDGNSAGNNQGGAIYMNGAALNVSASQFADDSALDGGAIYTDASTHTSPTAISTTAFTSDDATDDTAGGGGAIYDQQGALTVTSSTFSGNVARIGGGLFYNSADGLALINDTLDGNAVVLYGGALNLAHIASTGTVSLLNDTIVRNSAEDGGGIAQPNDANSIENTIVADNAGTAESGTANGDCVAPAGSSADHGGNIDSDGSCFGGDGVASDQVGVEPLLAPLADNGGPVQTDAPLNGSPAIAKAVGGACPATDARGVTRAASACDVGAFQTAPADLSLSASGPAAARVGQPITDTFTVSNAGPGAATAVTFTDSLPAGTTLFSASASQGMCTAGTPVSCNLGVLGSSQTGGAQQATVTVVLIATKAETLANGASVTAAQSDPNATNNKVTATTIVSQSVLALAPFVVTGKATGVSRRGAKLHGLVDPAGASTGYYFQYGKTKRYGDKTKLQQLKSGVSPRAISSVVKGLAAGTRYHYRLVATNVAGTGKAADATFRTRKAP
jgi:uncharacterized repeat protein (TIGR01451 family)/CSLREA domain-containing protein